MFAVSLLRRFKPDARQVRAGVSMVWDAVWGMAFHLSCRPFIYMGTGLIAPDRECVRGIRKPPTGTIGDQVGKQSEGLHESFACGDLIYSGHCSTSLVFLGAWLQNVHVICPGNSISMRLFRFAATFLFTAMFIVQMWGILATRHHYTVDVFFLSKV